MKTNVGKNPVSILCQALCVAFILCSISSSAYAEDWCFVASSKNYYYYVDSESMNSYSNTITFWIVQQDIESGDPRYKKQFTINCEEETVALRKVVRFGFSGAVRDLFLDEHQDEWAEIKPQSKMRAVHNIVCCDSRPRQNLRDYLQKTTVKKQDLRVSSEAPSDVN